MFVEIATTENAHTHQLFTLHQILSGIKNLVRFEQRYRRQLIIELYGLTSPLADDRLEPMFICFEILIFWRQN